MRWSAIRRRGSGFFGGEDELTIPYVAAYQMMNASLAYFTMKVLKKYTWPDRRGTQKGIAATKWRGAWKRYFPE